MAPLTSRYCLLASVLLITFWWPWRASLYAADKCFACHEALADKASLLYRDDVHFMKGISCSACHGGDATAGDMEAAMDPNRGYRGIPHGDTISSVCASCHPGRMEQFHSSLRTDPLALLNASVHGKLSTTGKERIVQCTTCHNAHGIVTVKDPRSPVHPLHVSRTCSRCHSNPVYMRLYDPGLPVDQLEKYRSSVHGMLNAKGDAKAAQCVSCHGSHDIVPAADVRSKVYATNLPATCAGCHANAEYMKTYGIPTDQFDKFSNSVHGKALLQKHDRGAPACNDCHGNHGATPPGVESISNVCGTCHALNAELFSKSPHKKAFDELGLPECETCHGNHEITVATNELLGTSPEAVCSRCHSESDNPKGFKVAAAMRQLFDSLMTSENRAQSLVVEAEQRGMEVGDAKFKLLDVRQARLEARTMVHSFDEGEFGLVVGRGLTTASDASQEARHAVDEYFFRRVGLGFSTLIITALAISLYLLIRRIEKQQQSGAG